jgi:hypothetical protein
MRRQFKIRRPRNANFVRNRASRFFRHIFGLNDRTGFDANTTRQITRFFFCRCPGLNTGANQNIVSVFAYDANTAVAFSVNG